MGEQDTQEEFDFARAMNNITKLGQINKQAFESVKREIHQKNSKLN